MAPYARIAADVNLDEEAELERLERGAPSPRPGSAAEVLCEVTAKLDKCISAIHMLSRERQATGRLEA